MIAVQQNKMLYNVNLIDKIFYCDMTIPFVVFCILAIIGIIVSTKEFFKK